MADTTPTRGGWHVRPVPPEPRSIVALISDGTLDAELAATVWVLLDGRVPLVVAGDGSGVGRTTLLAAFLDLVPPDIRRIELAGASETFDRLPQASELGWSGGAPVLPASGPVVRPESTLLVASELADGTPSSTWGDGARLAVRAASVGYGLGTTIAADSLDAVFEALRRPPVRLTEDELSWLGVVLVLRRLDDGRRRVVAAHYVRPTARDVHGHLQRLGPAVLATWDAADDRFEPFGWGIYPELATRVGRRAGDLELEVDRRRAFLEDLAARAIVGLEDVRRAVDEDRRNLVVASATTSATD